MRAIRMLPFVLLMVSTSICFGQKQPADTTKKDAKTQIMLEKLLKRAKIAANNVIEEEIQGSLIIDQTKTRNGREFYDLFNQNLDLPDIKTSYRIVIEEKPSLAEITVITVIVNDIEVYSEYLQPKLDLIEQMVANATDLTSQFIINYKTILLDMSNEEQLGTGIY
jgi:Curli assembly protein CsgE.